MRCGPVPASTVVPMSTNGGDASTRGAGLSSWREGPAKRAVVDFVRRTCGENGVAAVPPEERVAVFDNDGTLWCEKPMPIQLDFILRRLVEMAAADPSLRDRQPWKAASVRDYRPTGPSVLIRSAAACG